MWTMRQVDIPALVRIKPGALERVGNYLRRQSFTRAALFQSEQLVSPLPETLLAGLQREEIALTVAREVNDARFESSQALFKELPRNTQCVLGLGGGKALDVAKHVAFLAGLPYLAIPTSLSNDGFCSPQASLTIDGQRRSLTAAMPYGVVVDTDVCLSAPEILWLSGIGDLVCKFTAVADWKLAFHAVGETVDDFAALLSDSTVFQFVARPTRDGIGTTSLATALMLNGVAMGICGSSRPASGSEHLISHALDALSKRPRLHGLQVGVATYVVSRLQRNFTEAIDRLFAATGFWQAIKDDPFSRAEWLAAARAAPDIKPGYFTVLSSRDCLPEITEMLHNDPRLRACFVD
jgi:glycerol-1-phosphate dehydrogenase [NAD(P)+]